MRRVGACSPEPVEESGLASVVSSGVVSAGVPSGGRGRTFESCRAPSPKSLSIIETRRRNPNKGGYRVLVPVVLVTGMSGTGKSTALVELARRGHRVVDTDYGGLSEEVPTSAGGRGTLWREERIVALLTEHEGGMLFVSGCVANQGEVLSALRRGRAAQRTAATSSSNAWPGGDKRLRQDRRGTRSDLDDLATFEPLLRQPPRPRSTRARRSMRSSMRSSASQTRSPADSRPLWPRHRAAIIRRLRPGRLDGHEG